MRKVDVAALAGVALLLGGALAYGSREPAPPVDALAELRASAGLAPCPAGLGPDLPDLALPCLDGGDDVQLDGTPAGPTLVNIWGTWCGPCVEEVPDLVEFAEKAAGKVEVVGVLTTDTERNGLLFAQQFGMTYANLVDEDGLVRARYGGGTPLTLLIDAEGTVQHVESGKVDSVAELEALVAEHLGVVV